MADAEETIVKVSDGESPAVVKTDGDKSKTDTQPVVKTKTAAEEAAETIKALDAAKAEATKERAARAEAERRATEAENRERQSEGLAKSSTLTALTSGIEARKGARDAAQAALKAAWEAGDFDAAASAQVKIAELTTDLHQLNLAKEHAERVAKEPPQRREISRTEKFIADRRLPSRSAAWVRDHPEAIDKPSKLAYAHEEAMGEVGQNGFETPAYFAAIERVMGLSKQPNTEVDGEDEDEPRPARQTQQNGHQRRPPAAPPSSGAGNSNGREVSVRMTPEMRRAAEISGITEEEYAKNWLKAKSQGLIN